MNEEEIKAIIKEKLSEERYEHTLRVHDLALHLAEKYKAPIDKIKHAALWHDYLKEETERVLKDKINEYKLPKDLLHYNKELWHGPVGAMVIRDTFSVRDEDVLNAIYYHTSGRAKMGLVEQIIFVADYIEPGRQFPGVDEVRRLAEENLLEAVYKTLQNSLLFLIKKNEKIYPDTIYAYNDINSQLRSDP